MPGLIGKKIGMTSVFGADGKNIPCTVIEAGPCVVTQIRTVEKDGYAAVQLAYDEMSEKHASKALKGHFEKAGTTPKRKLVEFKADFAKELQLGDTLTVADVFEAHPADSRYCDSTADHSPVPLAANSVFSVIYPHKSAPAALLFWSRNFSSRARKAGWGY